MSDGPGEWVEKDAFVMPLLPKSVGVNPITAALLHMASFLELSGDEAVHPDWSVEAMESVGSYLQQLESTQLKTLASDVNRVSKYAKVNCWDQEAVEFLSEFLEGFGIET